MARALRAWAINRREKNSVRNFQYGPRTRLVRGIYNSAIVAYSNDVKYIWNNSYVNRGCGWKWSMIVAVNFPIEAIKVCAIFITLAAEAMFCPDAVCTLDLRNSHQFVSSPTAIVNFLAIKILTLRASRWGDIRVFRHFWSITTWCWKKSNQINLTR